MKHLLLLLLLFAFFGAFSQHTNVLISDQYGCNEPTVIINPKNTDQLYAGANLDNYYYSVDGGLTWETGVIHSSAYGVWGDPSLICDTAGAFYFFHLSNPAQGNWIDRIVCQKVTEPGGVWTDGTYTGLNGDKVQDKEWPTVDRSNNRIYVTWTQFDVYGSANPDHKSNIMFSKSTNGAETWSQALRINEVSGDCIDSDNTTEGAVPCIGPDGEIYVSWGGPVGLVFDRSLDGGETWIDQDIFVSEIPGGWEYSIPGIYRANGMPVTICDTSGGQYNGTIYINWSDQRNGSNDTDIWFVKSTDGGDTWSDALRVNDDPPGKHQFFTWMTLDQVTGYIYIVFYDRRDYDGSQTDVYMAMSTDGGESFINFRISETPFIPYSSIFFGDYTNITAHDNIVRPVWARLHNGVRSIWTALVDPYIVGVEEFSPEWLSLEQNYPNPFKGSTYFSFKLYELTDIRLEVYDQYGRLIATIIDNERMMPGKYTRQFDATRLDLPAGIYYFSLISKDQNVRRKMIIMK